ncbi:MAG: hypothetical protein MI863_25500 [Desulfobacterales bacterium]|nr:hypothetical protein [Desulfobacterales bacterium]
MKEKKPLIIDLTEQYNPKILAMTKLYKWSLLFVISILPIGGTVYLSFFQNPPLLFKNYAFHEFAIISSIFASGFVCYVTWQCYLASGEKFLRWIAAGLLGFTIVYAPHGFLTRFADYNIWIFILFGPASRLVMSGCLFLGLLNYGRPADPPEQRNASGFWLKSILFFILVDFIVILIAISPVAGDPPVRMTMEIAALILSLIAIFTMLIRRITSPLMVFYFIALACFAQSSAAFLKSSVWTHAWWYAHAIFVGGFILLSYGIVQAFHTTRSFILVYSQEELMENLRYEKARTEQALEQLQHTNRKNENLISELKEAMANVKTLSGFLPICASCKKIRDDKGYWNQIESYIQNHSEALFSHGLCPDCNEKLYGDQDWYIEMNKNKKG